MIGIEVERIDPVTLACRNRLTAMYKLSPFVWRTDGGGYQVMLRAVPRRDEEPRLKMAEIWHGRSAGGLHFAMDVAPVIFPGPDVCDLDGCEDPTVLLHDGVTHVWYTGWNQSQRCGRLLHASGHDVYHLEKRGVALDSTKTHANPKEATLVSCPGGRWRLFFEFARGNASRIGVATAADLHGPWTIVGELLDRRAGCFDDWHLSPGPVARAGSSSPVLFYNGATEAARWRIGWAVFDAGFDRIVARSEAPLIVPGCIEDGFTSIAFASSLIEEKDRIALYYSVSDRALHRAMLAVTGTRR